MSPGFSSELTMPMTWEQARDKGVCTSDFKAPHAIGGP